MPKPRTAKYSLLGIRAHHGRADTIRLLVRDGKTLTPCEVRQLRRALYEDEGLSRDEANALFELDRTQGACCPEWTEFFVECLTDHLVWQARPSGVVANEPAEWLIREIDMAATLSGVALLANVLAEAESAPNWLVDAARERALAPAVQAALARVSL